MTLPQKTEKVDEYWRRDYDTRTGNIMEEKGFIK